MIRQCPTDERYVYDLRTEVGDAHDHNPRILYKIDKDGWELLVGIINSSQGNP